MVYIRICCFRDRSVYLRETPIIITSLICLFVNQDRISPLVESLSFSAAIQALNLAKYYEILSPSRLSGRQAWPFQNLRTFTYLNYEETHISAEDECPSFSDEIDTNDDLVRNAAPDVAIERRFNNLADLLATRAAALGPLKLLKLSVCFFRTEAERTKAMTGAERVIWVKCEACQNGSGSDEDNEGLSTEESDEDGDDDEDSEA